MTEADDMRSARVRYVTDRLVAGIVVVAAAGRAGPQALTTTMIAPASVDPPMLAVCVEAENALAAAVELSGAFAVSVLPARRSDIAEYFADRVRGAYPMGPYEWRSEDARRPELSDAFAWFDCDIAAVRLLGADHMIAGAVQG